MWTTLLSRMRSLGGRKESEQEQTEHIDGCCVEASIAMTAGVWWWMSARDGLRHPRAEQQQQVWKATDSFVFSHISLMSASPSSCFLTSVDMQLHGCRECVGSEQVARGSATGRSARGLHCPVQQTHVSRSNVEFVMAAALTEARPVPASVLLFCPPAFCRRPDWLPSPPARALSPTISSVRL